MFLGVVGFLMVIIIVAALIRGKSNPVPLFVMVPVIAALICGFTSSRSLISVKAGVSKTWSTAVLFIFSIVYFSMMGDMGLFDPMVNWLVKKARFQHHAGHHCHGLHRRYLPPGWGSGFHPADHHSRHAADLQEAAYASGGLVCIIGAAMSIMNLLPWGGPVARTGVVLADVNALWQELIPPAGGRPGDPDDPCMSYMGLVEKRRGKRPGPPLAKLPSCRMMMKTNPLTMICHLKMQNS